jgi:hypothetical protein
MVRSEALRNVESTIVELGTIFNKLGEMVAQQVWYRSGRLIAKLFLGIKSIEFLKHPSSFLREK